VFKATVYYFFDVLIDCIISYELEGENIMEVDNTTRIITSLGEAQTIKVMLMGNSFETIDMINEQSILGTLLSQIPWVNDSNLRSNTQAILQMNSIISRRH
jgi:hypothetical protein